LRSSARASVGNKSYLKGSENRKQQGHRSLKSGGLAYQIDFAAADPDLYNTRTPYPGMYKVIDGRGDGTIPDAKFNDGTSNSEPSANVEVESLMPESLYLRQIVPFEIKITVSGLEDTEDDKIQFTAGWSTETTSKDEFGYDQTYGVLAAFVDTADGAHIDPGMNALVTNFTWSHVTDENNHGNEIQAVFNIEGLDDGDEVVIEVWMVLQSTIPAGATGNVHSRLIDARTLKTDSAINTELQTVPMMNVKEGSPSTDKFIFATRAAEEVLFCQ
jgi:hypothetical protein